MADRPGNEPPDDLPHEPPDEPIEPGHDRGDRPDTPGDGHDATDGGAGDASGNRGSEDGPDPSDGPGDDLGPPLGSEPDEGFIDDLGDGLKADLGDGLDADLGGDFAFDLHGEPLPLDAHESAMVQQDLVDLDQFEATFRADGYRGVSVYCRDCEIEHYYPWDLLRENLKLLLETGETPVHEPAFDPNPSDYVPWDYARGYADALTDAGVDERRTVDGCPACGLEMPEGWEQANFCPRCATPLLGPRLVAALSTRGLGPDDVNAILHEMGLPG